MALVKIEVQEQEHTCQRTPHWGSHPPDDLMTPQTTYDPPNWPKPTKWSLFIAKQNSLKEFLTLNHQRMPNCRMQTMFTPHTIN